MNWRKVGWLAVYVLLVEAIAVYYHTGDELGIGSLVPVLGGILLAAVTVGRVIFSDASWGAVQGEKWTTLILLFSPLLWVFVFYCVFGCHVWP